MGIKNILLYVDKELSIAIAANMVGVLKTVSQNQSTKIGANWLINIGHDEGDSTANQFDIRELLPEDLVYHFHEKISNKFEKLSDLIPNMTAGSDKSFIPGSVVSVYGKLLFPNFKLPADQSPFEQFDPNLKSIIFHGEECIVGEIKNEDYGIPVYFPVSSKYQIAFSHNQPVEITGVLRWTPPYSPGGGRSLNLALRCAILWLR
ncbi:MAG: hypothetical protein ACN4EP_00355 [Sediminibacterium sp.]|nr:hypothetical protein [uncultured Sediminibacterium sp.]